MHIHRKTNVYRPQLINATYTHIGNVLCKIPTKIKKSCMQNKQTHMHNYTSQVFHQLGLRVESYLHSQLL